MKLGCKLKDIIIEEAKKEPEKKRGTNLQGIQGLGLILTNVGNNHKGTKLNPIYLYDVQVYNDVIEQAQKDLGFELECVGNAAGKPSDPLGVNQGYIIKFK